MAATSVTIIAKLVDLVSGPAKIVQGSLIGIGTAAKSATAGAAATTAAAGGIGAAAGAAASKLKGLGTAGAVAGLGIATALVRSVDTAYEFDQAMTNVRKVMNLTRDEFVPYKDALFDIANQFPVRFEDVAESFRFSSRLSKDLGFMKEFARLSMVMQTAYDIPAEQAAEVQKNLLNAFEMPLNVDGVKQLEQTIDAINVLDNQFKGATAKNMLNFVNRVSGMGKIAHMTAPEIAAFGAVWESMGQSAEMTARNFANSIGRFLGGGGSAKKSAEAIKKLGYKNAEEFKSALVKGGANAYVDMLRRASKLGEVDRNAALKDLFGAYQARYLALLATEDGLKKLDEALAKARDTAKNMGSATQEATQAWEAYAKRSELAAGRWRNMAGRLGEIFAPLAADIKVGLSYIPMAITEAANSFPRLTASALVAASAFGVLKSAAIAFGMFSATAGIAAWINPWVGAITLAATAAYTLYNNWDLVKSTVSSLTPDLDALATSLEQFRLADFPDHIVEFFSDLANAASKAFNAISSLNSLIPNMFGFGGGGDPKPLDRSKPYRRGGGGGFGWKGTQGEQVEPPGTRPVKPPEPPEGWMDYFWRYGHGAWDKYFGEGDENQPFQAPQPLPGSPSKPHRRGGGGGYGWKGTKGEQPDYTAQPEQAEEPTKGKKRKPVKAGVLPEYDAPDYPAATRQVQPEVIPQSPSPPQATPPPQTTLRPLVTPAAAKQISVTLPVNVNTSADIKVISATLNLQAEVTQDVKVIEGGPALNSSMGDGVN